MASSLIISWQIDGEKMETVTDLFSWGPKSLQMVTTDMKLRDTSSLEEKLDQSRQHIKKQRHRFANKCPSSQSYGFPSSHVWMWDLDNKEGWTPKNWCFQTMVLEKMLESTLDSRRSVNLKENQPWIFTGMTDSEAEAPVLWPHWCKEPTHWKRPWC